MQTFENMSSASTAKIINNSICTDNTKNITIPVFVSAAVNTTTTTTTPKMLNYKNIAPAPTSSGALARKYASRSSNGPYGVDQTQSVQRRNARERNRVKQVNNSFARLRQHIPQTIIMDLTKGGGRGPHKKISKVDTLRIAVEYIRRLQDLVEDLNGSTERPTSSASSSNSSTLLSSNLSTASSNSSRLMGHYEDQELQQPLYYPESATSPTNINLQGQQHLQEQQQQQMDFKFEQQLSPAIENQQHYPTTLLTPVSMSAFSPPPPAMIMQTQTQLELTDCHSPSSSFNSSMSFDSGTFEAPSQQLSPPPPPAAAIIESFQHNNIKHQNSHLPPQNLPLKFEPYDNFHLNEDDFTPEDEVIVDYISLWEEQQ